MRSHIICEAGSSGALSGIPDDCIDYVFTDPPFGSNIFYGDCSFLWESWLGELTDLQQEAVWNKSVKPEEGGKTLDDYGHLMAAAFQEMFRVLKPGRWATVEFNSSDGKVFAAIKKAVAEAGFQIANMLLLDKAQKSFKQTKGARRYRGRGGQGRFVQFAQAGRCPEGDSSRGPGFGAASR